ncbi:hypothetical protein COT49_02865 [candidate division WWE3 bacterium CG08_land_8_20_14_0_20_40_13]|uniref:DUF5678 domain-containing protein n=1 Tax=candidate division WWE3 bacterium CG08_land_8_20_14_0_20_40_13 TaxID=1975084 RepID=A0A2H0XFI9_UNCKA|nr:MAG: hypothetical protein COT49_02865 [candidate division WWE3 bacterium CG08_land_8_20_14_0_20_40_13]
MEDVSPRALFNLNKKDYTFPMKKKISMMDIFKNPRYRGKHVVIVAGKIFTAKTGEGAATILRKLEKTYPTKIPEVAYLPKERSLILWM